MRTTATMVVLALTACDGAKDNKAAPKAEPAPERREPTPGEIAASEVKAPSRSDTPPDFTHGYCHVTGSGAVTFDQKTAHTGGSVLNIMQWHTEEMRKQMGYKPEGIILNCLGKDVRLSVLSKYEKTKFPMQPATYNLGRKGEIGIMGTVAHPSEKNGLSIIVQDGTLEVTAFDNKHIAGKGQLTAKTLPDKGEVTLTFDFDMQCRDLSGCPK